MPPDQPQNPDYSFLTSSAKPQKRGLLGFLNTGGDNKQRLLLMVAGGGVLLVVILGVVALIFGGGGANTERLAGIVAQQNELIRVAELGTKDATSAETKNFSSTVSLSMVTAENQLTELVAKQGRKLNAADENAAKDAGTDSALTTAAQVNRFDEVFNQTMKTGLQKYQQSLRTAYDNASSNSEKVLLQDLYAKATILAGTVPGN